MGSWEGNGTKGSNKGEKSVRWERQMKQRNDMNEQLKWQERNCYKTSVKKKGKKIKYFTFIGFPLFLHEPPLFFHFLPPLLNRRLWGCRKIHMPQEKWEGELSLSKDLCFFTSQKMTMIKITSSSLFTQTKLQNTKSTGTILIALQLDSNETIRSSCPLSKTSSGDFDFDVHPYLIIPRLDHLEAPF